MWFIFKYSNLSIRSGDPNLLFLYATSDFLQKKTKQKIPYSVLIDSNTDVVMCWCPCGWGALVGPNYGSVLHNYSQGCPDNQKADLLDSLRKRIQRAKPE